MHFDLDMFEITVKWTEYAPRVLELYPDIFAGKFLVVTFVSLTV